MKKLTGPLDDSEALAILSEYIQGCGGELEAGWQATADFSLSEGRSVRVLIRSVPPQDFEPADGTQRQRCFMTLGAVAKAMGLVSSRRLARKLTEPGCNGMQSTDVLYAKIVTRKKGKSKSRRDFQPHAEAPKQPRVQDPSEKTTDVASERLLETDFEEKEDLRLRNRVLTARLSQRDEEMHVMTRTISQLLADIRALRSASQM
ncbi:hypothetical protein COCSUDRAFT_59963 [Coccomyxa subellipsoidea C-169]|uniref:Uncharacterized protein n=1 Tax=Coccomyxa subellipsoidea (strain C-169) TaxID=574566 RepID=I0YJT5_COCSC|nr:hypothetical protein COCSUDRAFT_59963 [Coccomyxa subellipsoidea C-169]EIE18654.1 hypothetical protein COCSUDRAFT_59963 [Coccomyxa subellipsoidea C-169]|eukprot:XP_005643198.1 hypothetical protein COCSUDRAFT_59963 [Coccomyxa subellipsoidea C-169]